MEKETLDKTETEIIMLDERLIAITKELEDIESILADLEALFSKLQKSSLYNIFYQDFLAIMDLYYRERDKLAKEKERVIKKTGRLSVKKGKFLNHL